MQMDMQEPGEMYCCCNEDHDSAIAVSWKRCLGCMNSQPMSSFLS
jgi:hypothetical protein